MWRRGTVAGVVLLSVGMTPDGHAQETVLPAVEVITPRADHMQPRDSASAATVVGDALRSRPVTRPGEVLEAVPGLIVTQHSGEGKANQYFLRGFNLDHGTDIAIRLDGMPLNMPTHGHGQGYADTNFLIPELLGGLAYRKGPYWAEEGDFAAAGALHLDYVNSLPGSLALGTIGSHGYRRGLAATSQPVGPGTLLVAGEFTRYDGPWQTADDLRKLNGLFRYNQGSALDGFTVTGMAYANRWTATDQVPVRAVESGLIDRYGSLDPSDGGRGQRYSLSGNWRRTGDAGTTRVEAYAVRSTLDLFNNFTYFLDDPVDGDQFQQRDRRWIAGGKVSQEIPGTLFGRQSQTRLGVQTRYDRIDLGLYRTRDRAPLSTVRADTVNETSIGLYGESRVTWTPWLRSMVGLRGDWLTGRVRSDFDVNSGSTSDVVVSPKAGLTIGPFHATELFLNGGFGHHSNDLRGTTITIDPNDRLTPATRVPLLVRSRGAEIGLRTQPVTGLESSLAVFVLDFDSEILFVGDAGTTEPSRPSRRVGVEWTGSWKPLPWLTLDGEIAATRARFTNDDPAGDHIPGAPKLVATAGASLGGPLGWYGTVRLRHFGHRPLVEDDSARSPQTTLVNARLGYGFENGIRVSLDALNLFNARTSQIDYFYTSRLPGESATGIDDRHFHPAEPFALRFTLAASF